MNTKTQKTPSKSNRKPNRRAKCEIPFDHKALCFRFAESIYHARTQLMHFAEQAPTEVGNQIAHSLLLSENYLRAFGVGVDEAHTPVEVFFQRQPRFLSAGGTEAADRPNQR